jgi:hypothetical protein
MEWDNPRLQHSAAQESPVALKRERMPGTAAVAGRYQSAINAGSSATL